MYYIEIVKPKDGVISVFQKCTSSCPKFLKDYKCKHLLCLLYRKCHKETNTQQPMTSVLTLNYGVLASIKLFK